eukprot:scaffold42680_cov34-Tisochrysis_lutea.AAC.4
MSPSASPWRVARAQASASRTSSPLEFALSSYEWKCGSASLSLSFSLSLSLSARSRFAPLDYCIELRSIPISCERSCIGQLSDDTAGGCRFMDMPAAPHFDG